MSASRVFVTGYGAIASTGVNANEIWTSLLAGSQGIDDIKSWDVSSWPNRLGGEVKDFQAAKMLPDRKLLKVISRQDALGIYAAVQAVEHSEMLLSRNDENQDEFNDRTGVYVGSPGNKYYQQYDFLPLLAKSEANMKQFASQLFEEVHPMWLLRILPNNVLAYTGMTYGFKGPNHNITNHAVGGMQAIIEAYQAIRTGQADRVVVVAYDIGTEPQALYYYDKLGLIGSQGLKPFDKEHDGTILADGAAALVLESEASVNARAATCYAEILSGCSRTEGAGLFSIDNDGKSLQLLLEDVLYAAKINPQEIDAVIAHGNGNIKSDQTEAQAIIETFGQHQPPVTAFKWSMGHTICASGVIDTLLGTYLLKERCVPGIANFNVIANGCEGLNISAGLVKIMNEKPKALIINRGFASINTALVISAL